MSAPAIGYSPWDLYGPCECGAAAGKPCLTGDTGAERLVVHYCRRPVDDVTGAGFTSVLTRGERVLLAAVHRWARQHLPVPRTYLPRWQHEPGMPPGCWMRNTVPAEPETATVWWGDATRGELTVKVCASRYGEELLDVTVRPRSVREAVDLLVAWGILPCEFGSAYAAGQRSARLELLLSVPQPVLPRGWAPDGGADRPLPRLLGFSPLPDPALQLEDQ